MKSMNAKDLKVAREAFDDLYPYSVQPLQRDGETLWAVYNLAKEGPGAPYGTFQDSKGAYKLAEALAKGEITMRPAKGSEALYVAQEAINLGPVGNNLA